ncbi:MAG: MATE family efflux transporter [Clostridia bacterium]|nr:MATE family efflux transporter [Clostridia bacterium]
MNYHVRKIRNNSYLKRGKIEKDFTNGPIFKQMALFALPLMFTSVLQILFNTADVLVLGVFVGDDAVAAVGSTGSLINLITSLFIGMSMGVNVVASRHLGSHNDEGVKKVIGMSILLSVIFGFILLIIGWFGAKFFLTLMKSDVDVIDLSTTYLKVYFLGIPLVILYNFLSSIMRASGDSKRPLIYLLISGVVNVLLNVFFILVLKMTVEGVAIATVVAQGLSALLCIIQLIRAKGVVKLNAKYIRFYKAELLEVIKIGLPAGIQSSLFSLSNVFIQTTINKCGKIAMAGSSYAVQIEAYVYCSMNSISMAIMSFISQNYGAKKFDRIYKTIRYGLIMTVVAGLVLGVAGILVSRPIVSAVAENSEVVEYAFKRLLIVCAPYFLCGIMEVFSYSMRALGKSFTSMIISLLGSCVLRIIWVNVMFEFFPSYTLIFVSYPATWIITAVVLATVLFRMLKKFKRQFKAEENLQI